LHGSLPPLWGDLQQYRRLARLDEVIGSKGWFPNLHRPNDLEDAEFQIRVNPRSKFLPSSTSRWKLITRSPNHPIS
jgi:hypothetical protein